MVCVAGAAVVLCAAARAGEPFADWKAPRELAKEPAKAADGRAAKADGWTLEGGVLTARAREEGGEALLLGPAADWTDYTLELRARKLEEGEGFRVLFRVKDARSFYCWRVGTQGNARHVLEARPQRRVLSRGMEKGSIVTGRWYDIRIEVRGNAAACYLDGRLICKASDEQNLFPAGGVGLEVLRGTVQYADLRVSDAAGRRMHGCTRRQQAERMGAELGEWGTALRRELAELARAGADDEDERWLAGRKAGLALGRQVQAALAQAENLALLRKDAAAPPQAGSRLAEVDACSARLRAACDALKAGTGPAPALLAALEKAVGQADTLFAAAYRLRCPPIAFVRRDSYGMSGTNGTMHSRITGVGGAICVWDPAQPDQPPRTIFEDPEGFILDLCPSYDARTLLFSYKRQVAKRQDPFHIWEIALDGTGLRQVTQGRYHDFTPAYLPDGRIVFNSTRVESYSLCQDFIAAALHVCNADGSDLHRIEFNTLCDTTPFVMDDGTILFGRWEYQDKNIFCVQGLWTINPDGTRVQLFYGNTLTIPNSIYGARQVPGSDKVVAVMAAHHHPPLGGICLIDRRLGTENPDGMKVLTPEVPYRPTTGRTWRETNWGPGDILYPWSFTDPYPLSETLFLVSYGGPADGGPRRYRLYLLTDQGQKVPLLEDPAQSLFSAVPLRPRKRPPVLAGSSGEGGGQARGQGEGVFYVADIYQGLLDKGVKRGDVKELRILGQTPKKYNTEGPRFHDHYPLLGYGSYYVKVLYGTVPVDEDGSAYFKAPAGVELYFEAVDAGGKEIRRMGTVTQITAGEHQGCIGCHESRSMSPPRVSMKRLARQPDAIAPPPWGAGPVGFVRQVQPVLDKYCARCHEGRDPSAGVDLSGDKNRFFNMAYETLCQRGLVDYYYINQGPTGNFPPLGSGARVSRLVKMIEDNHKNVNMDDLSRRRIYSWIDSNCPYYDTWEMSRPHSQGGRDAWTAPDGEGRPLKGPWLAPLLALYARHCASCHEEMPRNAWINLSRPEYSRLLNAHLAKAAGGMGLDKDKKNRKPPAWASAADPLYQQMLKLLQEAKALLDKHPRMDMPGGRAIPQVRDFGRTY